MYFELLEKASCQQGEYDTYNSQASLEKFETYYNFMNNSFVYFVAFALDSWIKDL